MENLEDKLKNPVWYSLQETHQKFQLEFNEVKFYDPKICNFGAFLQEKDTEKGLKEYANLIDNFFLVSENKTPDFDENFISFEKKINGCQMVLDKLKSTSIKEIITPIKETHIEEAYQLIKLVMPGYFQKGGFKMGEFFGIFKDNKLVSLAGQRMQCNDFIEISSVVTHPKYTKRGFAKQLVYFTTQKILKENKLPILHTNKGNLAIPLYENLGYKITRDMNWWFYKKR